MVTNAVLTVGFSRDFRLTFALDKLYLKITVNKDLLEDIYVVYVALVLLKLLRTSTFMLGCHLTQ